MTSLDSVIKSRDKKKELLSRSNFNVGCEIRKQIKHDAKKDIFVFNTNLSQQMK